MWKQREVIKSKEETLLNTGVSKLLSRLLSQRNIKEEHCQDFLKSPYKGMSHPHELKGVEQAAKLFCEHAKNNSRVGVIGDYDCDGCVSSAMIYELCKIFGLKCDVFLPSRFDHGYGLNPKTVKAFKEKMKTPPDLLIVSDCGTNNFEEVKELKEWGIKDIIIIDHHIPGEESTISRNASVLVSWHFSENKQEMCACGEVFQFIRGIRWLTKKVDPIEFLTYAAVGTVADSSPIYGDNRIIVRHGLGSFALNSIRSSGLKALMNKSKIKSDYMTQMDVAFKLAPRINAVGRIDSPDLAFQLMIQSDLTMAEELADKVDECNVQRKALQSLIENQALKEVENKKDMHGIYGIVLKNEIWHIGIIGIVASRIAEVSRKPTLIFGFRDGKWRGSGRTIIGVNIKVIMDDCAFMFERYGGHAAAVGCVLKDEYVDKAQEIFNDACKKHIENSSLQEECQYYDATLKATALKEGLAIELRDCLSPYCKEHNTEPIFKLSDVIIYNVNLKEGEGWKLLTFCAMNKEIEIPFVFKTFSSKFNTSVEGLRVNLYFTMPQRWDNSDIYSPFDLSVVDIEKV